MASPYLRTTTSQNQINIEFDPKESKTASDCSKIVSIQFATMFADGKVIIPGDYYVGYKYQDKFTTKDGVCLDVADNTTQPDYQSNFNGQTGYVNIGGSRVAQLYDAPSTAGGDKGFYDENKNPGGWRKVVYEFVTFAWCMASGSDGQCGVWYEGISWTFTKTWENQRDKQPGLVVVTDDNIAPPPIDQLLAAFNLFNEKVGFVPCKKEESVS